MSPQDVIEYAERIGDDLNIVPETFRPAVEVRSEAIASSPYLASRLPRRFDDRLTHSVPRTYWYRTLKSAAVPLRERQDGPITLPPFPLHPRASLSMESLVSACSIDQGQSGDRRLPDISVDLEGASLYGGSGAHPPLAPSAHFMR